MGGDRANDAQRLERARALGLNALQSDLLAEAEAEFKSAIALAPREAQGYADLGLTYLRAGRLQEAEAQASRARALDSTSADIALLLASIHAADGREADARGLLEPHVRGDDADPRLLFALAQLDTAPPYADARVALLRRILVRTPTSLAVRLALLDAYVARGEADSATRALEEIRRLPPEPPPEALRHFTSALPLLRAGAVARAQAPLAAFRRALELTPAYQSSLTAVRGPLRPMAGRPALTFSPAPNVAQRATRLGRAIEDAVRFSEVTADAGLGGDSTGAAAPAPPGAPSAVAVGDYDGDGLDDLFASRWDAADRRYTARLYRAGAGGFADASATSGVTVAGGASWAIFADADNDGHLDLFALGEDGSAHLFRNAGTGRFTDMSAPSGVRAAEGARKALFADLDHDGDLDLVAVGPRGVHALRNDGSGAFSDETASFGLQGTDAASDVAFGDFDDDGRLDLIVARETGGVTLYRNAGARRFEDATTASGLAAAGGSTAITVGDYDNDGAFDLLVAASGPGAPALWQGRGDGTFQRTPRALASLTALAALRVRAAQFVDYDNDGWLDLVTVGEPRVAGASGVLLLRNDGKGRFEDRTALFPAVLAGAGGFATIDLRLDGDDDFVLAGAAPGPRLLRNDGGNANLFANVRLAALRTGSGKNNDFGIGAKLELRVAEMVQTRMVTGPVTHFGLGAHLKADVLRVQWPNGVPQVVHFPGSDQDVLENEVLKSSCGFLYAWDGERFAFVTDVMWRSALGMPLGIMGSNTEWAPAGASQEYLRIPGRALKEKDGRYVLQLTEELWETSYTDEVRLLAVDHPDSVDVFVDERFVPPGPVQLRMFQAARARPPRAAADGRGVDLLPALRAHDDVYVANLMPVEYQGIVESHDLVMDLGPEAGRARTQLYLRGWIYPTDASINVALSQQSRIQLAMPVLEVRDASGAWRKAADIGFPSGKDKTIVVDLAGKFPTPDHHVRIRTNMQIYWDQAFVAVDAEASPHVVTELPLRSADLHFRGISETYRKGGRYGPHWFDYDRVITDPVWRPIPGTVTRFGDVLPLLLAPDDRYIVMAPGDETTLRFDATVAPPLPAGWTRDFLLYSDGWIKDADLNTALGNTVAPLPFRAMSRYPYAPGEAYPDDAALRKYLEEYHTRVIGRR
ncbi:MAG: FG-GAP-like repeat-containing protein [Gemmatimonadota bacterium]|nr:FG-GAP-like repeat-containing protein [Gemmatimonadota bacterium]